MSDKEYFSYSKLNTFENCPRKFEFIYKKKYPRSNNVFSLKGTLLHAMIEAYLMGEDYNIPYDGQFTKLPLEEFEKMKEEFEEIKNTPIIQQLKKIYGKFELIEVEHRLANIFEDFSFNGASDTFVKNNNKSIIIDYKTGKVREDFTQLKYYALIYSYLYPEIEEFLLILSYVSFKTDKPLIIKKSDMKEIEQELLEKINNLLNTKVFNKKLTKLCDYCEYKNECMTKDQLDKVVDDIIDSKNILPSEFSGPLIYDGYNNSNVIIINDKPTKVDLDSNEILSRNCDEGILFWNIINEYEMKRNQFFILNKVYYVNSEYNIDENKFNRINEEQFNNILNIVGSKHYIVLGEDNFKMITNNQFKFEHDTKIIFKDKIIYMFHNSSIILNELDSDLTYNLLKEIKEIL